MIISRLSDEDWASIWNLNSSRSFTWRQMSLHKMLLQRMSDSKHSKDILLYNLAYILKQMTD